MQRLIKSTSVKSLDYNYQAICLMSDNKFEHIRKCFLMNSERFKFFVTDLPSRTYSVMLIDNDYVIQEYYRIKRARPIGVPSLLFIDKCSGNNSYSMLREMFRNEFDKMINYSPISLNGFRLLHKECIFQLNTFLEGLSNPETLSQEKEIQRIKKLLTLLKYRFEKLCEVPK